MSDWNPNHYLQFDRQRTQPSIDLVTRIMMDAPERIIDIGCGPGNSTNVLKIRWPRAEITGLDSSQAMIAEARTKHPDIGWVQADASGDLSQLGTFDVVFSNAAIQWIPDQERLLPKMFGMLNLGGILAVQVPDTEQMPVYIELNKLAASDKWKNRFIGMKSTHSVHNAPFYYDAICGLSNEIDVWETRYFHVMESHTDIVKWYSSTGLRPYLDCLKDDAPRAEFLEEFENALRDVYRIQADGRVLFPFTRIFFTAKKG